MRIALKPFITVVALWTLVAFPAEVVAKDPVSAQKPQRQAGAGTQTDASAAQIATLKKQVAAALEHKQVAEKKLAELRGQLKGLLDQLRTLKADQVAARKTMKSATQTLKKQQQTVKTAKAAKQKADTELASAKKALEHAKKQFAEAKTKSEAADKSLSAAQETLKKTQTQLATAKSQLDKSQTAIQKTEEGIADVQPKVIRQQKQLAEVATTAIDKQRAIEQVLIRQGKLVSFSDSIAPIFAKRCLACHNARTAKGRFNLETYASLMKGGESGPAIDRDTPEFSTLLALIEDGSMPKDADPLSAEQIELIRTWIKTGAQLNAGISPDANLATIIPKPPQPKPPKQYKVPIPVTALAFSPDGKLLASSGYHEVILWNPQEGTPVRRITNVAERVYDIAFSPGGKTMSVAAGTPGQLGEVKIFNVADGALLADLVTANDSIFSVAYSPDGKWIATGGADRAIRVFDVATQERLVVIEDHADWVMGVAFSPDGKKLASASRDKTSKVFDLSPRQRSPSAVALGTASENVLSGESLTTFNDHGQPVYDVAFAPDGKAVITGGADKQIRIWNPTNGKKIRNIGGFSDKVFGLQVTDAGRIVSCSADKTARIHTYSNGKQVRSFGGHSDWVYSVAYSPATKTLATGSYNGEVRLFNEADGKQRQRYVAAPGYQPPEKSAKK